MRACAWAIGAKASIVGSEASRIQPGKGIRADDVIVSTPRELMFTAGSLNPSLIRLFNNGFSSGAGSGFMVRPANIPVEVAVTIRLFLGSRTIKPPFSPWRLLLDPVRKLGLLKSVDPARTPITWPWASLIGTAMATLGAPTLWPITALPTVGLPSLSGVTT